MTTTLKTITHGATIYVASEYGNILQGSRTALTKRARELRKHGTHCYLIQCAPSLFHLGVAPDAGAAKTRAAVEENAYRARHRAASAGVQEAVRNGTAGLTNYPRN